MDDAVDHSGSKLLVAEHGATFPKLDISCEYDAVALIARRHHPEQQARVFNIERHSADSE